MQLFTSNNCQKELTENEIYDIKDYPSKFSILPDCNDRIKILSG